MPEGDTLRRTADVLGAMLSHQFVSTAYGRPGGARLERVAGHQVTSVRTIGKHLLIDFSGGLSLHTHLGMRGTWHRYRPNEPWRLHRDRAVAVIETPTGVAVCFDAPTVELIEQRALSLHPVLRRLGPDLLAAQPDIEAATERLQSAALAETPIAIALLDQRAAAGLGNVYRSEVLFIERQDPFAPCGRVSTGALRGLLETGARLLRMNTDGGARTTMPDATGTHRNAPQRSRGDARLWVYRCTGRPCRRCSGLIRSTSVGALPRRLYWCPTCQASVPATSGSLE